MGYNSMPYLFVKSQNGGPAYQIISDGQLWMFENQDYRAPTDRVLISTVEVRQLVSAPVDRDDLWSRCDGLFKKRKAEARRTTFVSSSEEFGLSLLLEETWRTLNR